MAISLVNWKAVTRDNAQVEIAELSAAQGLLFFRSVLDSKPLPLRCLAGTVHYMAPLLRGRG
jgi:hypothetical protein